MHNSSQRRVGLSVLILALMLGLAVVLSAPAAAQGPAGDVITAPEQIRVPLDKAGADATTEQKQAETDCYPCSYWVTGIRIQKLSYPLGQPLAGWQFTVFNAANQQVAQDVTGPNGYVDFFNLAPGVYRVVETQQTNWTSYYPNTGQITIPVYGGYVTFFRFYNQQGGIVPPPGTPPATVTVPTPPQVGSLTVCKLDVTNSPAGTPVGGWPFTVTRGPVVVGTFTTSPTQGGCETIIQLPVGQYLVEEGTRQGWEFVGVEPAGAPGSRATLVNVTAGPNAARVTFRNRQVAGPQTGGAIRACKLDVTSNAQGQAVAGWFMSIQVSAPGGGTRYGYTGYDGCVTFLNLPPGAYTVSEAQRSGWQFVSVDPAAPPPPSGTPAPYTTTATVAAGATTTVTFRNQRILPASIRVCTLNTSATPEVPINGWQVWLRRSPDAAILANAWTGTFYSGAGCVTFGNLVPGAYIIEEAAYPGWRLQSVTPDDANTTDLRTTVTVGNGENATVTFRNQRVTTP